MITRDIPIRVRYYETDCMGFVHHSNYVRYYETARTAVSYTHLTLPTNSLV